VTFLQVAYSIEAKLTAIGLRGIDGEPIEGLEALPTVWRNFTSDQRIIWNAAEDELRAALEIDPRGPLAEEALTQYEQILSHLVERTGIRLRHAMIKKQIEADAWSAREES
jgi:hypothetical protein